MLGFEALGRLALGQVSAGGAVLVAESGSFVFSGVDVNFRFGHVYVLSAGTGSFVFGGGAVALDGRHGIVAYPGSLVFTGQDVLFKHGVSKMPAECGQFVFSGGTQTEFIYRSTTILPDRGQPGKMEWGRKIYAIPGRW